MASFRVIGEDPGVATDIILHLLPIENIHVAAGTDFLPVPRKRSITVTRGSLQRIWGLIMTKSVAWLR